MKRIVMFLGAGILCAAMLSPLGAAEFLVGESAIPSSPIDDDAYIAGGKVLVNEPISGDAAVTGGSLIVNAEIGEDLLIAGGSLVINGPVGDDLRAAGGDITISGDIADDLIAAGGNITVPRNVRIGGDLLAAGGQVTLEGTVAGNLKAAGGRIVFRGEVLGDADLRSTEEMVLDGNVKGRTVFAAGDVELGPAAAFEGPVEYWLRKGEVDFGSSAAAGILFKESLRFPGFEDVPRIPGKIPRAGILASWVAFSLLSGTLLILILVLLSLRYFTVAGEQLAEGFWKSAGLGFLFFLVTPCLSFLLMISLLGLPLGIFLLALYIFSFVFALPLSALVLARWIERRRDAEWGKGALFGAAFVVLVCLKVLSMIPVAGWLVLTLFICAAFGSLMSAKWSIARS